MKKVHYSDPYQVTDSVEFDLYVDGIIELDDTGYAYCDDVSKWRYDSGSELLPYSDSLELSTTMGNDVEAFMLTDDIDSFISQWLASKVEPGTYQVKCKLFLVFNIDNIQESYRSEYFDEDDIDYEYNWDYSDAIYTLDESRSKVEEVEELNKVG